MMKFVCYFGRGWVMYLFVLMLSCDHSETISSEGIKDGNNQVTDVGATLEASRSDGATVDQLPRPRNKWVYGVEVQKLDPNSKVYKNVVEKIQSLEGAEEHKVELVVELEKVGIEVRTRIIGESYGWVILVKVGENGVVEIVKKDYWRA